MLRVGPCRAATHLRSKYVTNPFVYVCRSALTSQWLFQLYLALECDLWIGTRNSNWNRLIDEMRCAHWCLAI